jgi:t-SNARE complex subunit (syntaxin)
MDYIVDDRGEKINKIEKIMSNIHGLAKDIAVKVDEQEEGLVNID